MSAIDLAPTEIDAATLRESDVLHAELWCNEWVAVAWHDATHGVIVNLRFGSGRHETAVGADLDRLAADADGARVKRAPKHAT